MDYRRILTIQDISCLGQCSMTVAMPILSACGVETCILPSAVLSTHTGGFTGFTVRDLSQDIPSIRRHWQKEGICFDAVYTGYLGSADQVDMVLDIMNTLLSPDGFTVVDPAMADNGKLYGAFDEAYVKAMGKLCRNADIVIPNITEACLLCGMPYRSEYDEQWILSLLEQLSQCIRGTIVLTGVSYTPDTTGIVVYTQGESWYYAHKKVNKSYHGTGDIYSSACVGALCRGLNLRDAVQIAGDYTLKCIENTLDDATHWYGVKFETALPMLIRMLEKKENE